MIPVAGAWFLVAAGLVGTLVAGAAEGTLATAGTAAGAPGERPGAGDAAHAWLSVWALGALGPFLAGLGAAWLAAGASGAGWGVAAGVLVALLAVTLARLGTLAWGSRTPVAVAGWMLPVLAGVGRVAWPVVGALRALRPTGAAGRTGEGLRLPGEALRALVQGDEEAGAIEDEEMEMIAGIMELGETRIREVMVPRIDIVAIPIDTSLDTALDVIIGAGHSRIPVFAGTVDDIVGLLYAKDLLRPFRERDFAPDLRGLLREPYFVPQTKPVDVLLAELQTRKVHMAIVVDEYGGTAGLVTIEDLIEEIVGEIQDEYDREAPQIETSSADEVVCLAGVSIDDVNDLLGIDLPADDADTLAGLVFAAIGRVPEVGDRAAFADAEVEVLALDGRRIHRVRVCRRRPEGEDAERSASDRPPPDSERAGGVFRADG